MNKDDNAEPILDVVFYKTQAGNEPVREWLKRLSREDRRSIGEDIKTAQYGWPLGMPLIRKLNADFGKSVPISMQELQGCSSLSKMI